MTAAVVSSLREPRIKISRAGRAAALVVRFHPGKIHLCKVAGVRPSRSLRARRQRLWRRSSRVRRRMPPVRPEDPESRRLADAAIAALAASIFAKVLFQSKRLNITRDLTSRWSKWRRTSNSTAMRKAFTHSTSLSKRECRSRLSISFMLIGIRGPTKQP